jgi:hypothetical protein
MLVIAAIAALLIPKPGLVGSVPTIAALLLVAVLYAVNLHADYKLAEGPSWTAYVRQAREQCEQRGVRTVDVVIAPAVMGWGSRLSCCTDSGTRRTSRFAAGPWIPLRRSTVAGPIGSVT